MIKFHALAVTLGTAVFTIGTSIAPASAFTFTKIADTSDSFSYFSGGEPIINSKGTVAFVAGLNGRQGIFTGDGEAITAIVDNSGTFYGFSRGSINTAGTIAFYATLDDGTAGIFTSSDGAIATIVDTSGAFSSVYFPDINEEGTIAFVASLENGTDGVFTSSGGAITTIVDGNTIPFLRPSMDIPAFLSTSINSEGTVAFDAFLDGGKQGIFTSNNGVITRIADTSGAFSFTVWPVINAEGTIVFNAGLDNGNAAKLGLFTSSGGVLTSIVDNSGAFSGLGTVAFSGFGAAAINSRGMITFTATLEPSNNEFGGVGIYTGSDLVLDKIIAQGDPLFGSIVTELQFYPHDINDAGQVAFYAKLANGVEGIYRADPDVISASTPEPTLSGLTMIGLCLAAWSKRKGSVKSL